MFMKPNLFESFAQWNDVEWLRNFFTENKEDLDTFTNYISRIRKAILKETNDTYAVEQFAVEGWRKDNYGIAGATDENRDKIRKEFRIK